MSSDLDFDRGDSCGSFEFLSSKRERRERRPSALQEDSIVEETCDDDCESNAAEDDEDEKLFQPVKNRAGSNLPRYNIILEQ